MAVKHFNESATLTQISKCYAHAIALDVELRKKVNAECAERMLPPDDLYFYLAGEKVNTDTYFERKISIKAQFDSAFEYLATYANREGCSFDKATGADTECRIGVDFAPLSFCFSMFKRKTATAPWEYWFDGGLIYQGPDVPANGSAPSLTVSMDSTRVGWFVHT